jgi:hypothetical protein
MKAAVMTTCYWCGKTHAYDKKCPSMPHPKCPTCHRTMIYRSDKWICGYCMPVAEWDLQSEIAHEQWVRSLTPAPKVRKDRRFSDGRPRTLLYKRKESSK